MHLIDDEYTVAAVGGLHLHLLDDRAHVLDAVVRCGIELDNVHRPVFVEAAARITFVAGFAVGSAVLAVDGFGEDARTGSLADATGAAEQVGVSQTVLGNRIFERGGESLLSYYTAKS